MDFCPGSLDDSSTHTASKVVDPKHITSTHWYISNANSEKNLSFSRIENLTKNSFRVICSQKNVKIAQKYYIPFITIA
jgi:hypothetical protein